MKLAIALAAAGVLSASLSANAQGIIQPNSPARPGLSQTPGAPPTVGGAGMSPGQFGTPPGKMAEAQAQIGGVAPPALPSPANLMDPRIAGQVSADIYSYMALFQKLADQQRASARESRDVARESQIAALQDAAEKMKQAAAANMQQAQVAGAMAIASGVISMGTVAQTQSGVPGKSMQGQTTAKSQASDQLKAPTKALTSQEKQQATGALANAQQVFAASMAAAETDKKKAEIAQMQAQAQVSNGQQAQMQQMMQQMQDVIRDIQQKLQAIQQSQAETTRQIMRN
jgi:hypothetical protein